MLSHLMEALNKLNPIYTAHDTARCTAYTMQVSQQQVPRTMLVLVVGLQVTAARAEAGCLQQRAGLKVQGPAQLTARSSQRGCDKHKCKTPVYEMSTPSLRM